MSMILAALSWLWSSKLGRAIAAIGAALLGVLLVYQRGRSDQRKDAKVEDMEHAIEIRKRADQAARDADGDTRPVDDRLREHKRLRD